MEGKVVRLQPSLRLRGTLTDNVFYSATDEQAALIAEATPRLDARVDGDRLKLKGYVSVQSFAYPGVGIDPVINPFMNGTARLEAIENFFFVEASANLNTISASPFGPRPVDNGIQTNNRIYTRTLGIAPYIQGKIFGDYKYLVRYDNIWNSSNQSNYIDTELVRLRALVESPVYMFGWSAEGRRNEIRYPSGPSYFDDVARARLIYQPDRQLRFFLIGGRESYGSFVTTTSPVYGGGADWKPSDRTTVALLYEERFFGPSYNASFNHRTRLTSWRLGFTRNIGFFQSEALRLGTGDIAGQLDALFARSIEDPVERELAVQRLLQQLGAPVQIGSFQAFYAPRATITERADASVGILGVRNSLVLTYYATTQESLYELASSLPQDAFSRFGTIQTRGWILAGNHKLDAQTSLSLTFTATSSLGVAPTGGVSVNASTSQRTLFGSYNIALSAKTTALVGLRFSRFGSPVNGISAFDEKAIIVGLDHQF